MRLVLQSPAIREAHLAHIHQLSQTSVQFVQIGEHAYYLPNQAKRDEVLSFCLAQNIDASYVDDQHLLKNYGLCVMDMDSTLINIECIDEIADMMGIKSQISAITERAMRGEIDFSASLRERVALLKGLDETNLSRVLNERLQLNPGAIEWIATCKKHQIKTVLVSGGFTFFSDHVKALLDLDDATSNTLDIVEGKLTGRVLGNIIDAQAKADILIQKREAYGLNATQTIAIGDGANDLKMMGVAGIGIAYHAKAVVQAEATYAINFVGLEGVIHLLST